MPRRRIADPRVLTSEEMRAFLDAVKPKCPDETCGFRGMKTGEVRQVNPRSKECPLRDCVCESCNKSIVLLPTRKALRNAGVSEDRIGQLGFLPLVDEVLRGVENPDGVAAVRFMHGTVDVLHSDGCWTLHQRHDPDRAIEQFRFEGRIRTF